MKCVQCEARSKSTKSQCKRMAATEVDGCHLCTQHSKKTAVLVKPKTNIKVVYHNHPPYKKNVLNCPVCSPVPFHIPSTSSPNALI